MEQMCCDGMKESASTLRSFSTTNSSVVGFHVRWLCAALGSVAIPSVRCCGIGIGRGGPICALLWDRCRPWRSYLCRAVHTSITAVPGVTTGAECRVTERAADRTTPPPPRSGRAAPLQSRSRPTPSALGQRRGGLYSENVGWGGPVLRLWDGTDVMWDEPFLRSGSELGPGV